jgi:hypothetical protein
MKLDLLYEVDVPKPWPGEHPYGQRAAEQKAYAEAIEQIRLADELGFHCTSSTTSARAGRTPLHPRSSSGRSARSRRRSGSGSGSR